MAAASIAVEQFRSQLYTREQASQLVDKWTTEGSRMPMGTLEVTKQPPTECSSTSTATHPEDLGLWGSGGTFLYMARASGEEPEVPPDLCQPLSALGP